MKPTDVAIGLEIKQVVVLRRALVAWANEAMRECEEAKANGNKNVAHHWAMEYEHCGEIIEALTALMAGYDE